MKLVRAYKVDDIWDADKGDVNDRIVGIVYRDNFDRRSTMFVTTGTHSGAQVLIDLINGVGEGEL